jgi:hypothetical protein
MLEYGYLRGAIGVVSLFQQAWGESLEGEPARRPGYDRLRCRDNDSGSRLL